MHIAATPSFSQATPINCEPVEYKLPPTEQSSHAAPHTQTALTSHTTQNITAPTHCEFSLADDFKEALEFAAQRRQRSLQWIDLNEIQPQSANQSYSQFGMQFGIPSGRHSSQTVNDESKIEYGRLLCEIVNLSLVWLAGTAINLGCGIISTFILVSFIVLKLVQSGAESGEKRA